METYTHNLKIILINMNGNIVLGNEWVDEIKNALCRSNTKEVQWNGQNLDVIIKWHRKELNNIEKQFMGDLFTNSIYDSDSIIVNHTNQIIKSINKKYNYDIKFYISRVIGDKTICKESCGVVY
jgi:hypothetical protein